MYQNPYIYGVNPCQNLAQQQQIQYYQNQLQALEQQAQGQQQIQQLQNPLPGINGKYIQNLEEITVSDVPMNGAYSIFPKRDMTEIYAKAWDGNGNIQTVVYRPVLADNAPESGNGVNVGITDLIDEFGVFKQEIMARFDALEKAEGAKPTQVKGDFGNE